MKIIFAVLYFVSFVDVCTSFDLFGSMDDAREALMGFYDPIRKSKPPPTKTTTTPKPKPRIIPKVRLSRVGWGSRRRRSRSRTTTVSKGATHSKSVVLGSVSTLTLLPFVKKTSIAKPMGHITKRRPSTNKFAEALEDIERSLADAQEIAKRVTHDIRRVKRLQSLIKTAVRKRSYRFARKAIGEAMFTIMKIKEKRKRGRGKRETVISAKNFLGNVRKTIGQSAFNDLLAMQGQVTLTFAIDKTGSMADEIDTAKKIAQSIVDENRVEPVDYILSPFSDPESASGKVLHFEENQKNSFVQALKNIKADGGGDCPELIFKGMKDAIDEGQPQLDSPMYVFTDAGPKDGDKNNVEHLSRIAKDLGIVINFFVSDSYCSAKDDITSYEHIARETTGQVFRLKDTNELGQLSGMTGNSLGGTAVVSNVMDNVTSRQKRSNLKQTKSYSIPVDDSIVTLVISMTTDKPRYPGNVWSVSLTTPSGNIATPRNLNKGVVYQISHPTVGVWKLRVTGDQSLKYDYYAKASSANNIDFEYYFVKKSRRGSFIPINSPVKGQKAQCILTLGGVENINKSSVQAELMNLEGQIIGTTQAVSLKSKGKAGVRHSFTFTPPGQLFKIKLKGKTKKGNCFERISHNAIKSETLLVRVLFAKNDFTIPRGKSTYLVFLIENLGNSESVDILVFGSLGRVDRISRTSVVIRRRRRSSFSVTFTADRAASPGVTITIVASVKGKSSSSKSTLSIPLLVV